MYDYQKERPDIFTEQGQKMLTAIRDTSRGLFSFSGAALSEDMMKGVTGGSWTMLACIDYLAETGDVLEVKNPHSSAGQHRIFIKKGEW